MADVGWARGAGVTALTQSLHPHIRTLHDVDQRQKYVKIYIPERGPAVSAQSPTRSTTVAMSFNAAATKLRQSLEQGKDIVVAPGVHDGFSARIAHSVGFDCLYMARSPSQFPP